MSNGDSNVDADIDLDIDADRLADAFAYLNGSSAYRDPTSDRDIDGCSRRDRASLDRNQRAWRSW